MGDSEFYGNLGTFGYAARIIDGHGRFVGECRHGMKTDEEQ